MVNSVFHEIVYEISMQGIETNKSFKEVLTESKLVTEFLSETEIEALLDPTTYVGYAPTLVDEFIIKTQHANIWR